MSIFGNIEQDNYKADFGFCSPHETKKECEKPVFANKNIHRLAIQKDFHLGSKGDIDENGVPGWVCKRVCTGCGKQYKKNNKLFIVDKKPKL